MTVGYDALGNISSKSDVGSYTYSGSGAGPHAVTSITGTVNGVTNPTYTYDADGNMTAGAGRTLAWTSFNMVASIVDGSASLALTYDSEHNRIKQCVPTCTTPTATTDYLNDPATGSMEETYVTGGTTTWRDYIKAGGNIVALRSNTSGTVSLLYFVSDHLGSISSITDSTGALISGGLQSYDPWGLRRNASGTPAASCGSITSATTRGYTAQEEIDSGCLVNLNGRIYDPTIGRLVSADTFVPNPANGQSFNRYSYVNNGPLSAIDPSGYGPQKCTQANSGCAPWSDSRCLVCGANDTNPAAFLSSGQSGFGWASFAPGAANAPGVQGSVGDQDSETFTPMSSASLGIFDTFEWVENTGFQNLTFTVPFGGTTFGGDDGASSDINGGIGGWYDPTNTALGFAGVGASVAQYGSGAATLGSDLRVYSSGWSGNQYVSTLKISNLAEKLGNGLLVLSVGLDLAAWNQGNLSTPHLTANLTMDAMGAFGGPVGAAYAAGYFGLETFYPGGAAGALNDYGNNIQQNQAIDPYYTGMVPGKISFHPKARLPDVVPNHKKPEKRDNVIDPYDLPMDPGKI